MRIASIGRALGIAAVVAIAGCSSGGSSLGTIAQGPMDPQSVMRYHVPIVVPGKLLTTHPAPRLMTKSWAIPDASAKLVYTCAFSSSFCEWFKVNRNAVQGQITGFTNPQGIGVDPRTGDVYIANTGGSDVPVFAKGSTTMIKDLSDPGQFPVDVAIDKNGTAYVANIFDTSFGNGSVSVYPANATTPSRTITDSNFIQVISVAVDEHHLLVVCYNGTFGGQCDEFPNGRGHGVPKITGLFFAGGVAFDNAENFVVSDQTTAFDVFNGTTFALCSSTSQDGRNDVMVAINRSNSSVAAADFTNGTVDQYAYGSCTSGVGALTHTYHVGTSSDGVTGVAYDPSTRP